jgi:hypothetical protein
MQLLRDEYKDAFRIGVVGPSRVGKTSLIAAILRDSQELLSGTPVEVQSEDQETEKRVTSYRNRLDGQLKAGQFMPDAMHSTQEPFVFVLNMFAGDRKSGVKMAILDYPGGWLDPQHRPRLRQDEWHECREFIRLSTVLMVPIDAAVVMEAAEARERAAIPAILTMNEVMEVTRSWAKRRDECKEDEPGLLMLAPLKCESYFADNGGLRDDSGELQAAVRKSYSDVIAAARKEAPSLRILYSPVDTIGCVELVSADWHPRGSDHDLEFTAKYRVRPPRVLTVKGADAPLILVCQHLAEARRRIEVIEAGNAANAAEAARLYAERHEGLLRNMWFWLNGERRRRADVANARSLEATRAKNRLEAFERATVDLSNKRLDARVAEF